MNRRDRRASAARERHARRALAIPAHARTCFQLAADALDRVWARNGVIPCLAMAIEGAGSLVALEVHALEAGLAELELRAPSVARHARAADRLRRLAGADGILVAVPRQGKPVASAYGRPGRFLAEEHLEDLVALAAVEVPVAAGGVA